MCRSACRARCSRCSRPCIRRSRPAHSGWRRSADNRLTSTLGTASTSYAYDAADQLTSSTTGSTITAYGYDGEGNQTKAGNDTFTYDLAGQISAATVAGAAYTYDHDAEGNQVTASKDGAVTSRTQWDPNAPLPILASEYDSAWALKQSYRYDPLGQPTATATGAGSLFYYHHDTQGSPVDVTGNTGTLYQRWSYDSFGTRVLATATSGAPASTPSYTGARYETTTGNLDLHARQYNTGTGRFTRPDPATRDQATPYVSPYAYADNAPTLYTDPSGLTPVPGDDNGNGKVDSLGEGLKIFGNGFLRGLKAPYEFMGDAHDALTGENGGAGAFLDKYLPVRPAYRLYRAEYMLRQQGCDALADQYADAADELTQQIAVTGIGGLTGWRRDAVNPSGIAAEGEIGAITRLLYGARKGEGLPGSVGVQISKRPSATELENLTVKHGVEFAVVYKLGPGPKGTGGQYYLYSGVSNRVQVPVRADTILVYHTHPKGYAYPSPADKRLLDAFEKAGSPMRSSQIIPVGKSGMVVTFTKHGVTP
ncbi:RHS repeat domain-containing protein [Streptomyces griseoluteus]|uniref:RHS repeat domain-containing protein n=1 Tax=Streptomyces griseoluteus TaxID=29306 RepID=UPI003829AE2A